MAHDQDGSAALKPMVHDQDGSKALNARASRAGPIG
jgi:hypothetical protein